MAKFFFFVCAAALCLAQVHCRVARDAQETEPDQLQVLSEHASNFLNTMGDQFSQLLNAKDGQEVGTILKTNTNTFIGQVQDLAKNLQEKLGTANGDLSNVVNQVVAKLNQTVTDLQDQNPEVTAMAKDAQAKLQEGFKTVVAEADKLGKTLGENSKGVQEDLAKLTKKAYDQVLETAQAVQKQVHEAANKPS